MTDEANRILMVREVGRRHPVGQSGTEGHFVYADLHSSLGYTGPVLPGGWLRIWYGSKVHNLNLAANKVTWGQAPYEDEFYTGNWYFGIYDVRNWCWGKLGTASQNDWWGTDSNHTTWTWHEGRQRYPQNWAMRLDGLFKPPASGTWQFQVQGTAHGWCYFGIGGSVSSAAQGFDAAPSTYIPSRIDWWINSGWFSRTDCACTYSNMDSNLYYPIAHYNSWCCWSGGHYVQARRLLADNVTPDPQYSQINLNSQCVYRIP
jgi:hypothetical protein